MCDSPRNRRPLSVRNLVEFQRDVPARFLFGQFLWFLLWLITTGCAIWLRPDPSGHGTHEQLGLPPCASMYFLGRPCPGCGLTTSWTATVHGSFAEAFHAHALGPILYLGFSASALVAGISALRGWRWRIENREISIVLITTLVVLLSYATWRFFTVTPAPH